MEEIKNENVLENEVTVVNEQNNEVVDADSDDGSGILIAGALLAVGALVGAAVVKGPEVYGNWKEKRAAKKAKKAKKQGNVVDVEFEDVESDDNQE